MGCVPSSCNSPVIPPLLEAGKRRSGATGGCDGEREWRSIDYVDRGDAMAERVVSSRSCSSVETVRWPRGAGSWSIFYDNLFPSVRYSCSGVSA